MAPINVTLTNGAGKKLTIRGTTIGRDFKVVSTCVQRIADFGREPFNRAVL
jgi:hypothetical protein